MFMGLFDMFKKKEAPAPAAPATPPSVAAGAAVVRCAK